MDNIPDDLLKLKVRFDQCYVQFGIMLNMLLCATNWELGHTEAEIGYIPAIIEFIGYCPYIPTSDLIARLKTIRWAYGLTQEKLAKLMRVDESSLCSWERGEHRQTPKSRKVIAEFLSSLTPSLPQE